MLRSAAELVRELISRSAHPIAHRTAALQHEAVDHPMEDQAVVERPRDFLARPWIGPLFGPFGQADKVRHRLRSLVIEEMDLEVAFRCAEFRESCHAVILTASQACG